MTRKFFMTLCLGCTLAMPAAAAPTIEEIIAQLEAQGYADISVSRTWLGRIRIEAESNTHEREIVFNQRTGEILRDFWEELDDEDREDSEDELNEDAGDEESDEEDEGDDEGEDD
jgi:Tfp pilus assembly pilus retraction ATPase PilT